jgi:peroxiredoxin
MTIAVGDKLPEATFKVVGSDGTKDVSTAELFSGQKVVLFGVTAAFSPTCHRNHLPGFLDNLDALKGKGVDRVAVVSTNDHWVMKAWSEASGGAGKIDYLADGNGTFTHAIGMQNDASGGGMGTRSKRFSMIVDDGVVKAVNVEEVRGEVTNSGVAKVLEEL